MLERKNYHLDFAVNPDHNRPSHQLLSVQLLDCTRGILSTKEPHQTETSFPSITSFRNLCTIHFPTLTEKIFELARSCFPGEIAKTKS